MLEQLPLVEGLLGDPRVGSPEDVTSNLHAREKSPLTPSWRIKDKMTHLCPLWGPSWYHPPGSTRAQVTIFGGDVFHPVPGDEPEGSSLPESCWLETRSKHQEAEADWKLLCPPSASDYLRALPLPKWLTWQHLLIQSGEHAHLQFRTLWSQQNCTMAWMAWPAYTRLTSYFHLGQVPLFRSKDTSTSIPHPQQVSVRANSFPPPDMQCFAPPNVFASF